MVSATAGEKLAQANRRRNAQTLSVYCVEGEPVTYAQMAARLGMPVSDIRRKAKALRRRGEGLTWEALAASPATAARGCDGP